MVLADGNPSGALPVPSSTTDLRFAICRASAFPRVPRAVALQRALALGRATLNHFMGRLASGFFEESALGVLDPRVLVFGIRLHLPPRLSRHCFMIAASDPSAFLTLRPRRRRLLPITTYAPRRDGASLQRFQQCGRVRAVN